MTKSLGRAWVVLAILVMARPVAAGVPVTDCASKADGIECVDEDDNPCTLAACDDEACDQNFGSAPSGTSCPDTDGDICSNPGCNGSGLCDQVHTVADPGTTCPDTDGDPCSIPSCNFVGGCNQTRSRAPAGTECPDTDGIPNTQAACDGVGNCVQNFVPAPSSGVPALSVVNVTFLAGILLAFGGWRLRRRPLR